MDLSERFPTNVRNVHPVKKKKNVVEMEWRRQWFPSLSFNLLKTSLHPNGPVDFNVSSDFLRVFPPGVSTSRVKHCGISV